MISDIKLKIYNNLRKQRARCVKKFLHYFRKGYTDPKYIDWERGYKQDAHRLFQQELNKKLYRQLLKEKKFDQVALTAVRIESKTNLLFSFEKMALRDAIKPAHGSEAFATGLYDYLYGSRTLQQRFESFTEVLATLPRVQTRVLTWPLQTVFGFIGNPKEHIFLKPRVTKIAAEKYQFNFNYRSQPNWNTYKNLIEFAELIRSDTKAYQPKDYIDLQSFIWVMGSDEYPDL